MLIIFVYRVHAGKMRQLLLWDSLIFDLQTNANETYYYGDYFLQRQKMNLLIIIIIIINNFLIIRHAHNQLIIITFEHVLACYMRLHFSKPN